MENYPQILSLSVLLELVMLFSKYSLEYQNHVEQWFERQTLSIWTSWTGVFIVWVGLGEEAEGIETRGLGGL